MANEKLELLLEICEELKNKKIIYKMEECNKHIKLSVNNGGSLNIWRYLADKFEELGFEVEVEAFGYMLVYYDDKKGDIDKVFDKYLD